MGAKESDRTLMTVESNIGGRGDSIAEASTISLPKCLDMSFSWQSFMESKFLFFFGGASCRLLMSGLSQAVQTLDNALFQTLIKVRLFLWQ